jgi:hypothetical protein
MLVEIDPEYRNFLNEDGTLIVKLEKALYGCLESAKLWYDELSGTLLEMGFEVNPKDKCVFNALRGKHQVTVCIYVDDILCTSVDSSDITWVEDGLRKKYGDMTTNHGKIHSYLGQTFDLSTAGECRVSMEGYIRDILDHCDVKGTRVTPATEMLFDITADVPLLEKSDAEEFHSRVAKLLYLALRARPDILTAVSFLTTRVSCPTEEDLGKLDRLLMYLNGCPNLGITLKASEGIRVLAYVDASFAIHHDMKSHTGGLITLGSGPIYVCSKRQGLVTKSSTESELVGISDVLPQIIWVRDFLLAQGYSTGPAKLFEDNMSTIAMANRGASNSPRTRHIAIRFFFVKDRIEGGEVVIEHLGTEDMLADALTKPLQGDLFRKMRGRMMGVE